MSIKKYAKIFADHAGMEFSRVALDRTVFFLDFSVTLFRNFIWPIIAAVIYSQTSGVPGWTLPEFILFQGTFLLSFALAGIGAFNIVWDLGDAIDEGMLDIYLVKPLKLIPGFLVMSFNPFFLSDIFAGITIVTIGLISSGWVFNLLNLLMYIALMFSSVMIWFFIAGVIIALNFRYPRASDLMNLFWNFKKLGEYPLTIYGDLIKFLLTFVIPLGLAGFYPSEVLLGRVSDLGQFLAMIGLSLAFGIAGYIIIKRSVKGYESAGG